MELLSGGGSGGGGGGGTFVDVAMTEAHTDGKLVSASARLAQFLKVLGTRIEP